MKSLKESLLCESSSISNGSYTAIHGEKQRIKDRPRAKDLKVLELKVDVKKDKIIFKLSNVTNTTNEKGVKNKIIKEISKTEENIQTILTALEKGGYYHIIPIGSTSNKEFAISNSRNGVKILFDDLEWSFRLEDKELKDLITFFKSI